MARGLLNLVAGATVVLAIAWQVIVLSRHSLGGDDASKLPKVNIQKLVTDLKSTDPDSRNTALRSVLTLAGTEQMRPQLVTAGIPRQLLDLMRTSDMDKTGDDQIPLTILALTRLARGEEGGPVCTELVDLKVLPRMVKIMKKGVSGWTASCAQLLHAISKSSSHSQDEVTNKVVNSNGAMLHPAAVSLLEFGAFNNHTDALVAAVKLLELLVLGSPAIRDTVTSGTAIGTMLQILSTMHENSHVSGAIAQTLVSLADKDHTILARLVETGSVTHLMTELRAQNKFSLGSILLLIQRLVNHEEGREQLVGSGLLSLCVQLIYSQSSQDPWRISCLTCLLDMATEPMPNIAVGNQEVQRRVAMSALVKMANQVSNVALHNSVIEAFRDVGSDRRACEEMVRLSVPALLATLLARTIPDNQAIAKGWLMQTQRSSAMAVALIALQPHLRKTLTQTTVVEALATCIHNYLSGKEALGQQLRITAAAALVPLISESDGLYDNRVVESGVLADLITMYYSSSEQERKVAAKAMLYLQRMPSVKALYERTNIVLPSKA